MILELAPMEGITTYTYRNALNKYYGGIDKYFSPFISTHKEKKLNYKEINDILPENNDSITLIPQVLTNDINEFINTTEQIKQLGYKEINLNFGCPSATVTSKNKGAGILAYPEKVDKLLDDIFCQTDFEISVKTRLGYAEIEEWSRLLKIYEKYPLKELIIHGRIREDFYKNKARLDVVKDTVSEIALKTNVSYNGDIYTMDDYKEAEKIDNLYGCMLGRGIITDPSLARRICDTTNKKAGSENKDTETFKKFNLELMNNYARIMGNDRNALFKLKEIWVYMNANFDENRKLLKKIQKCKSIKEYEMIILSL